MSVSDCEAFDDFAPISYDCVPKKRRTKGQTLGDKLVAENRKAIKKHEADLLTIKKQKKQRFEESYLTDFRGWRRFWLHIDNDRSVIPTKITRLFRRFWFHVEYPDQDFLKELHRQTLKKHREFGGGKEKAKIYREKNLEHFKEYGKKWKLANKTMKTSHIRLFYRIQNRYKKWRYSTVSFPSFMRLCEGTVKEHVKYKNQINYYKDVEKSRNDAVIRNRLKSAFSNFWLNVERDQRLLNDPEFYQRMVISKSQIWQDLKTWRSFWSLSERDLTRLQVKRRWSKDNKTKISRWDKDRYQREKYSIQKYQRQRLKDLKEGKRRIKYRLKDGRCYN